jgi:uncharacterized protein
MGTEHRWYDLFSRGARDWLRHNAKVRDAVRSQLPELIAGSDVLSRPGGRTVRVPVRFLEHYRFRLRETGGGSGVGQGAAEPGDVFRRTDSSGPGEGGGTGGSDGGELRFEFEFQLEEIVDWLWEELRLPDLKPRQADTLEDHEVVREGWDKRGPRARLDRRRTMKEAIKRRIAQPDDAPAFSDEDLRFRQLAQRRRPSSQAVVLFVLDVSASMDRERRRLAKSFFFWALQGIRRRYTGVETVFLAHTNEAWEFTEEEFFQASATGGTVASSAFRLAHSVLSTRYDPARYNAYVFYASDGDNFADDGHAAQERLAELGRLTNFMGFVETPQNHLETSRSATGRLFRALQSRGYPVASYTVHKDGDIWDAIRAFFQQQAAQAASAD